jgi:hypothetical protein
MGRFRRAVEQQELGHSFVDKQVEQNFGEEAPPAARRDESGPIPLFSTATASLHSLVIEKKIPPMALCAGL